MLGIAGSVGTGSGGASSSDGAELTFGGGLAYMLPLHRYFVLGAQLAVLSWRSESSGNAGFDRNLTGDLTLVPQGRLPLTHAIVLYVSLPVGASLDFANEYHFDAPGGAEGIDADPALGWTLSILAGARFALGDSFGLLVEAGYTRHSFAHDVTLRTVSFGATLRTVRHVDIDLGQLALHGGIWF